MKEVPITTTFFPLANSAIPFACDGSRRRNTFPKLKPGMGSDRGLYNIAITRPKEKRREKGTTLSYA
jgi:hypothetical protein